METRICNRCFIEKPLTHEFFYREKLDKLGYGRRCKPCNDAVVAAYYALHPEKMLARGRRYASTHKVEAVVRTKAWVKANEK